MLAAELAARLRPSSPVVLALPRGGVPVAAEVAAGLSAPLGVILVRKLGVPGHRELAMGALAMIGDEVSLVRNTDVIGDLGISDSAFEAVRAEELAELERRRTALGGTAPLVTNAEVIVVDDGLATGSTMLAAVSALRAKAPAKIVAAIPVASRSAVRSVERGGRPGRLPGDARTLLRRRCGVQGLQPAERRPGPGHLGAV